MLVLSRSSHLKFIYLLIACSGFAALAWEVIWQIKSALALGVSALGAALTLAVMMGGMSLGSFLMGNYLKQGSSIHPLRLYGLLECMAGIYGLFLYPVFMMLEKIDSFAYAFMPDSIFLIYLSGMIMIFTLPTLCMGATLPVFALLAEEADTSLAKLYGINIAGGIISVLILAFFLIPCLGMQHTIEMIAAINIMIGLLAWIFSSNQEYNTSKTIIAEQTSNATDFHKNMLIVFVTGFATFTLEVAWFRSLMDVLPNTTDIFAIILACTLLALSLAARDAGKKTHQFPAMQLCIAGILILIITPVIERMDYGFMYTKQLMAAAIKTHRLAMNAYSMPNPPEFFYTFLYALQTSLRFLLICLLLIPPIRLLGRAFPWILNQYSSQRAGMLYAINTFAAILGSISAAWILLPLLGFAKTAWIAGLMVVTAGIISLSGYKRFIFAGLGAIAFLAAIHFETGIGKIRAQGFYASDDKGKPAKLLEFYEGPEATVSAMEYEDQSRVLLINSTAATWEAGSVARPSIHYMAMMGHLPMTLHPHPQHALVICFGTGQTSNAVRKENPESLDIVDVNANIFKLAHQFRSNENVLQDARVRSIVMDGRAWLRRSNKMYDVITLEPMPPSEAGVNALYSREFYELARKKLTTHGVIAQWLPFHLVAPYYTASIAKTFIEVFPNAILWIDQESRTGILLGSKDENMNLTNKMQNDMTLDAKQLQQYSGHGVIISDDNQLLAYGKVLRGAGILLNENIRLLQQVNKNVVLPAIDEDFR